jgi:hypothetical protein
MLNDRVYGRTRTIARWVEIEMCPRCGGAVTVLGFVTQRAVVRRILTHLDRRDVDSRAGPWAAFAAAPG